MSETGNAYLRRGAVGWQPAIGAYKAAVEAAIAAQGVGYEMHPPYGEPPRNLAEGDELPGFAYAAPESFVPPAKPDGVFLMASETAGALVPVLRAG